MNIKALTYQLSLFIAFILFYSNSLSQTPGVKTFLDKDQILIGEQLKLKINASYVPGQHNIIFPAIPDTIAHFEIVERGKIDTIPADGFNIAEQVITFTSFDSGRWSFPSFSLTAQDIATRDTFNLDTDSFSINVSYSPPDSTNEPRDIKPIRDATEKNYLWYYVAGGVLLALLIAALIYQYFKNRKKKPKEEFASDLSPVDEAMQALEKLKKLNLQQPDEIKEYHSSLSSILKRYISRRHSINVMNLTTYDVLIHLSENGFDSDKVSAAAAALRTGDAVKFAKYLPLPTESENSLDQIKAAIRFSETIKQPDN